MKCDKSKFNKDSGDVNYFNNFFFKNITSKFTRLDVTLNYLWQIIMFLLTYNYHSRNIFKDKLKPT